MLDPDGRVPISGTRVKAKQCKKHKVHLPVNLLVSSALPTAFGVTYRLNRAKKNSK